MVESLRTGFRRTASLTLYASLWLITVLALPLLAPLALLTDLVRGGGRWATTRCLAFACIYLTCEIAGIVACLALWLIGRPLAALSTPAADDAGGSLAHRLTGLPARYLAANFRLQCWWATTLYGAAERIFALRTLVQGDAAVRCGPFLLLLRHASLGDTLLPAVLIGARHAIALRYIMKRELLWDPCLDIVGNRLPNYFVRRGSGESEREIARLQRLMDDLGRGDGVLIFPEGTRFTPAKRDRAVIRLEGTVPPRVLAMARALRHVLPPRLGGTLGLLEKNPGIDAVFCAHTGFEGTERFSDLLAGSLIGREIRVCFWRVPFAQIPASAAARAEWLYEQWLRVDAWIAAQHGEVGTPLGLKWGTRRRSGTG